jgi:hypothetical protein
MAETEKGKKFIRVPGYTREDGTKVHPHVRSTPDTSRGAQPKPAPKRGKED